MPDVLGGTPPAAIRMVWVRLLPGRPRWRMGVVGDGANDWVWMPDVDLDLGDDPISMALGVLFLLVLLPPLLLAVVGVALLGVELLAVLALLPLLMIGQLTGLRPWVLVLYDGAGGKRYAEVTGTAAMLRARRGYRALSVR